MRPEDHSAVITAVPRRGFGEVTDPTNAPTTESPARGFCHIYPMRNMSPIGQIYLGRAGWAGVVDLGQNWDEL